MPNMPKGSPEPTDYACVKGDVARYRSIANGIVAIVVCEPPTTASPALGGRPVLSVRVRLFVCETNENQLLIW